MSISDQVLARWRARQAQMGYRGKVKDTAALNFLCGAAAALEATHPPVEGQDQNKDLSAVLFRAFMVSARGAGELDDKPVVPAVQSAT